ALSIFLVVIFFFGILLIMAGGPDVLHQPSEKFSAGGIYSLGESLFSKYLLPFEVASLLLLVALIGTVYLAKRKI
ncbi:MAG TPA: NADH-quinone oxidoreductase subunit J, partial [Candidatus Marinimicrobia bacterium]|nr:NADH-quinone oxidoreductase subunit J [Candidatus Neomarinimicrobiota bacterium]